MRTPRRPARATTGAAGLLAALAYLPLLLTAPSRLPADTKLGLTLDPGRLMSTAMRTWDTDQFAGWVPHQSIAYLWPSGPFYWLFEHLGVPAWAVQRLFLGTVLFLAGLGMFLLVRRRAYGWPAALVAALAFQLSPYVLPYASRTSVMLMPWAAVPWMMLLVPRCTGTRWLRPTALFALVVLTMGAVNLTATMMVAPAPLLALADEVRQGRVRLRAALLAAVRIGVACLAVSLWWIVMLSQQGRYGADVLGYSETLQATSATSTALEVLRQSGYWLAYVVTPKGATTTAAVGMMSSIRLVAASLLLVLVWLGALLFLRFRERWLAAALVLCGVVLAVGTHPIDDASPLMSPIADASRSSLALAMRSSTRAVPLLTAAVALSLAALVQYLSRHLPRARAVPAVLLVALLVAANLPSLFKGSIIDRNLLHDDTVPAAWSEAARVVDEGDPERRVVQLPGVESQAFTWGYTVDPPLAWTIHRPLLTRDWLPLGMVGAMDLWYAFDDRFQDGTAAPQAVAAISRLTGSGTIWLAGDTDSGRFDSATPEAVQAVLDAAPGVRRTTTIGPVTLYEVEQPRDIASAATEEVVLVGSGDGIVDAASAGLLHGTEVVRYAATMTDDDLRAAVDRGARLILTDSNRKRARQWRGSQDVWGALESPDTAAVTRFDPQDVRFPLFPSATTDQQTVAAHERLRSVVATSYGSPLRLLPEFRPAQALDGDPTTAWEVGHEGGPVIGEAITLDGDTGPLRVVRAGLGGPVTARVTAIRVSRGNRSVNVPLGPSADTAPGQQVEAPAGDGPLTVTIIGVDGPGPTGLAELLERPDPETVRTPLVDDAASGQETRTDLVLTRLRDGDEEPVLRRVVTVPAGRDFQWSVEVRGRTGSTPTAGCTGTVLRIDGTELGVQLSDGDAAALADGQAVAAPLCDPPTALGAGRHTIESTTDAGLDVDRVVATSVADGEHGAPEAPVPTVTIRRGHDQHRITVTGCPDGCWVVFGEGYSTGWSAASADATVGPHTAVNGGMNGWWVEPQEGGRATLTVHWAPQRTVDLALLLSALLVLLTVAAAAWPRRHTEVVGEATGPAPVRLVIGDTGHRRRWAVAAVAAGAVTALAVDPAWGAAALAVGLLAAVSRRPAVAFAASLATVAGVAIAVVHRLRTDPPRVDFGWPAAFEGHHRPVLAAVVAVTVFILVAERRPAPRTRSHQDLDV